MKEDSVVRIRPGCNLEATYSHLKEELIEIQAMGYAGEILQKDEVESLISFTYPFNPENGCGRDGLLYAFVENEFLEPNS
jgi:hypothetical protein